MIPHPTGEPARQAVSDALRLGSCFIVTSHVRPDGDAIGSSVALALALRSLGKQATVVLADRLPDPYPELPCTADIRFADRLDDDGTPVVVLECGDLERTGLGGLDRHPILNVDHHPGNTGFGTVQWFDGSAAACGEMVYDLLCDLGVRLTADMATHLHVAIVTDTGSFRYPGVSPRTFETCARLVEAGADPVAIGRLLHDSNTLARIRLQAAVLSTLDVHDGGSVASLSVDPATIAAAGAEPEDTDGLINIPLSVKHVQAAVFFKAGEPGQVRVSLRSKGALDVGRVARGFGGGGHRNASGCTVAGTLAEVRGRVLDALRDELAAVHGDPPSGHV